MTEESNAGTPKKRRPRRLFGRCLSVLLLIIVATLSSLYIPGTINTLASWILPSLEAPTGMKISADNIELRFPLRLKIDNLLIRDSKALSDTMIAARQARLSISPAALFRGKLNATDAIIENALYRSGGPDSLYINARIDSANLALNSDFAFSDIAINSPEIIRGRVDLIMGTAPTESDSSATTSMLLQFNDIKLRNLLVSMYMASGNDTIYARIADGDIASGEILSADTVSISSSQITLQVDSALYGTRNAPTQPGLDLANLLLRDIRLDIDSFAMHGPNLTIPISRLEVQDLAGIQLSASGEYAMTETALFTRNFDLTVNNNSRFQLEAMMGTDSIGPVPMSLDLTGQLYPTDLTSALPALGAVISPLPSSFPIDLRALIDGTMDHLQITELSASMPSVFTIKGKGSAGGFNNLADLKLNVDINGKLQNSHPFASLMPSGVKLPPLTLQGNVAAQCESYSATMQANTASGLLALDGRLSGKSDAYSINLITDSLPLAAFMPELGIGAFTAVMNASGSGLNPLAKDAELNASIIVSSLEFNNYNLQGLSMSAELLDGNFNTQLNSKAPAANMTIGLKGYLNNDFIDWDLNSDIRHINLRALGLSDSIMTATMQLASAGHTSLQLDSLHATANAHNIALTIGTESYRLDSLNVQAQADRTTSLSIESTASQVSFIGNQPLTPLLNAFSTAAAEVATMIEQRNILVDSLVRALPDFKLNVQALPSSPIQQFLKPAGINFNSLSLNARKDSVLLADANILKLSGSNDNVLDTITANLTTRNQQLVLDLKVNNRPGNLDAFANVGLRGIISGNTGKVLLRQQNSEGKTGYKLGLLATITDSVLGVQLTPFDPVIAYRNWTINEDNYIAFNPSTFHLYANLDANGGGSRIRLLTSEVDSLQEENNVRLTIDSIRLQDWMQISPFAPPIAGLVGADMTMQYTQKSISGEGTLALNDLTYGRNRVGDFNLDLGLGTDFGGAIYTNLNMAVNGKRTFMAVGAVNDSTKSSPLNLYMRIKEFPLDIANPFLPASTAQLAGTLNGHMNVGGHFDAITLDGNLSFRNANVKVGMMGSTFALDSVDIPVAANMVEMNNFAIYGGNQNPLRVNGCVDLRRFEMPRVDMNFTASNMQFVNSQKGRGIDLYGRGFMDLDATVKGSLNFLDVNAKLAILPETNLTYQMSDASVAAGLQPEEGVVRFVNFADTTNIAQTDSLAASPMLMNLSALLDIRQGSQFTVNLSADGTNRAQIKGQGILDYNMSPIQPEGRLTGRFTIDDGSFRYSLPVISEKLFTFERGSYVAFDGAILNPTLNITAKDQVRANVTRSGENSRLVNFDVILNATGTPERLNVNFDLTTTDDITVANELQSMSENQRANQAMNLLLYGVYSGTNSASGPDLTGNALYGFLASQLNSWAAKSIKGVDLSFGLDHYNNTLNGSTTSAMQYSYKVSKTLFNDRFKIVVGGNYSTDANAEENLAQNLISDISFEYMLNRSGSMYVKLFRKTGYESILEGEITQTGAGFVLRRKIRRLGDIFNFSKADR